MTSTSVRARARARALAILMPLLCVLGAGGACTEELRSNGQSCLKNGDCISGYCASSTCVAAPPLLDAEVNGDGSLDAPSATEAGGAADAASDVVTPPKEAGNETGPSMEASTEAGPDGASMTEGGADAPTE
jgi:hypothetical protein